MKKILIVLLSLSAIFAQNAEVLFKDSKNALDSGDLNIARDKILEAIEADKSNKAFRDFESKIRNIQNKLTNANRSLTDRRYNDSIEIYNEILEEYPKILAAIHGQGKAYYYKKDYVNALNNFKKALEVDKNYSKARQDYSNSVKRMYLSVNELIKKGQNTEAIEMYELVLKYDPKFYRAHYQIGKINQKLGKNSDAIKRFDAALAISKNQPKILFSSARSYREIGDTKNAIKRYEMAIKLDEKYFLAYKNLGDLYLNSMSDLDNAIINLKLAIKYDKKIESSSYLALSDAYNQKELFDNTISILTEDKVLKKFGNNAIYWYNLSIAYNAKGDCSSAIKAAESTINSQKRRSFGGGYYQLGVAQWCNGEGNRSESIKSMKKAREDRNFRAVASVFLEKNLRAINN